MGKHTGVGNGSLVPAHDVLGLGGVVLRGGNLLRDVGLVVVGHAGYLVRTLRASFGFERGEIKC